MEHEPLDFGKLHAFMRGLVDAGPTRSGHRTPTVIVVLPLLGTSPAAVEANSWMIEQTLAQGVHGIHFHEKGKCKGPDFESAGAHLNPGKKQHGFQNPKGFHAGDLPNVTVKDDGTVNADLVTNQVTLEKGQPNSLLKKGGTALVIHAQADDYKTDPSGNSGARIACGAIR